MFAIYINFVNQSEEAINHYAQVFETKEIDIMRYKDMPEDPNMPIPEDVKEFVMHGELKIGNFRLMFSDAPEGFGPPIQNGNQISIMYGDTDFDKLKALFDKLAVGGEIKMPFEKTFWSDGYGMLTDKFGIGWQFNTYKTPVE